MSLFERIMTAYDDGDLSDAELSALSALLMGDAATLDLENNVTISFHIDNSDYTNDTLSGYSHVQVESYEGLNQTDFTYEALGTGKGYWVKGTGVLVQMSIPAGTSLSESDLSFPKLTIANHVANGGVNDNANTYVSPYSWVNADNMVCSTGTVFSENADLYLSLYSSDALYYLEYCCGPENKHSISMEISSLYPNATINVGQSVSESYIPTASHVNAYFTDDDCSLGVAYGKVFDSWYLLDQSGAEVPFVAGMQIDASYLPTEGNAIFVYAKWKDKPDTVTVSFQSPNGAAVGDSVEIATNTALGDAMPVAPEEYKCTFVGWSYDGGQTFVNADTPIANDMVLTAVYDATVTVYTHDYANGNPNKEIVAGTYTVRTGLTLADAVDSEGNHITAEPFIGNYMFLGWWPETDSGYTKNLSAYTIVGAVNISETYEFMYKLIFQYEIDGETHTAWTYYVKGGGSMYDAVDENGVKPSSIYEEILAPVQVPGYTFNGWTKNGSNYSPSYYDMFQADTTFVADLAKLNTVIFQRLDYADADNDGQTNDYVVVETLYVAANQALSTAVDENGAAVAELPVPEAIDGVVFEGWTATVDGALTTISSDTVVTTDLVCTASFSTQPVGVRYVYRDAESGAELPLCDSALLAPGAILETLPAQEELDSANYPADHKLIGWQIANADGQLTDVVPPYTVAENTTFYAVFEAPLTVTFAYPNDAAPYQAKAFSGMTLGEVLASDPNIPDPESIHELVVDGETITVQFAYWTYVVVEEGETEGVYVEATEDVVINKDMTFVAAYDEWSAIVTLHDVAPDGSDYMDEDGVSSVDISARPGQTLGELLSEYMTQSGLPGNQRVWYTVNEETGEKTPVNLDYVVEQDMEIYTYSYQIVLQLEDTAEQIASNTLLDYLFPSALAATVEVSGNTITITYAEGETLKMSDFIVDGVDYTMYTWTFTTAGGTTYTTISDLIADVNAGNTSGNITGSRGSELRDAGNPMDFSVNFYVYVNGQRVDAAENPVAVKAYWINDSSYYLSAAQVEAIYNQYGFTVSDLATNRKVIAHASTSSSGVWNDRNAMPVDGVYFIPVVNRVGSSDCSVYYLPNAPTQSYGGTAYDNANLIAANTFYTVTIQDESGAPLKTEYALTGENKAVSVNNVPGCTWECLYGNGTDTGIVGHVANGMTTFALTNVTQPYVIKPVRNSSYAITIEDDRNIVYTAAELTALNETHDHYSVEGTGSATITLRNPRTNLYAWVCEAADGTQVPGTPGNDAQGNAATIFSIDPVDQNYSIRLEKQLVYQVVAVDVNGVSTVKAEVLQSAPENVTVTLDNVPGYEWVCDGVTAPDNGDGTVSFTFSPLNENKTITQKHDNSDAYYYIKYVVNINDTQYPPFNEDYRPHINGLAVYEEAVPKDFDGTYTLKRPEPDWYDWLQTSKKYMYEVSFTGWLSQGDVTVQPGDLTASALAELVNANGVDGVLTLTGQWHCDYVADQYPGAMKVNFFVMFNSDATELGVNTPANMYTTSVFGTEIVEPNNADALRPHEARKDPIMTQMIAEVEYKTEGSTSVWREKFSPASNEQIRKLADAGGANGTINVTNDEDYNYKTTEINYRIANFPNDDYIFDQLRKLQTEYLEAFNRTNMDVQEYLDAKNSLIVYDGEPVPVQKLNARYFTIEWYVFKVERDCTHIDGRLKAREAELTIVKSFYGDEASIDKAKANFNITVTGDKGYDGYAYSETLNLDDCTSVNGNTYTWKLNDLRQDHVYSIQENNYIANANKKYLTSAEYIVANSDTYADANRWQRYNPSNPVRVTATSYLAGESVQMVYFVNSYVPEHTMLVHKINGETGSSLAEVEFQLLNANDQPVTLYEKAGDPVYHLDYVEGSTQVADSIVETDSYGRILIGYAEKSKTLEGTYKLVEQKVKQGYDGIDPIVFEVTDDEINGVRINVISGDAAADGLTLEIRNHSKTTHVAVKKTWGYGTPEKEVEIELYRVSESGDLVKIGSAVLNGTEYPTAWEHEWDNLPLFDGDQPTQYKAKEIRIGNINHDESDTDGFTNYVVTNKDIAYYDSNGTKLDGPIDANGEVAYRAVLEVDNRLDTGDFSFSKVDANRQPLAGATFTLYSVDGVDESALHAVLVNGSYVLRGANDSDTGITPVKTAVSQSGTGLVSFGTVSVDEYYMVEASAPANYAPNTNVYKVSITNAAATITALNDATATPLTYITNLLSNVTVTLTKKCENTPLAGAVFGIYNTCDCTETPAYRTDATAADGTTSIQLPVGTWYMKELTAPTGYLLSTEVYTLEVKTNGTWVITNANGATVTDIQNTPDTASVTVVKVDGQNHTLNGATFQLTKDRSLYPVNGTTSANFSPENRTTLENLPYGTYTITETVAPAGYYRMTGSIEFTIANGEVTCTEADLPTGVTFDSETNTFTVANVAGVELPHTGGSGTIPYTAGGLLLMAATLLYGIGQRRKREGRETE